MGKVSDFPRTNPRSIADMLRRLADRAEAFPEEADEMVVVSIRGGDLPPVVYQFGNDSDRLRTVGALADAQAILLQRKK